MPSRFWLLVACCALGLKLRSTPANSGLVERTSVGGVVYDSTRQTVLASATVQLVSDNSSAPFGSTVTSDSLGRFVFADVPTGRYALGFFHPMLDSLGLEPIARALEVGADPSLRVDLAIPGTKRIRRAICGASTAESGGAVVMGFVRDARSGDPIARATVVGEWLELSFGTSGISQQRARRVVPTRENGWYAICNAPSPGTMTLMAIRESDSTDVIEMRIPADAMQRRELYVGTSRTAMTGEGRLSGTVVAANGGQPLAGAQIQILNGPSARANERGQWSIADAPVGTRTIEVRAVGHYPERRSVDIVGMVPTIRTELLTLKAVLETMKVTASRLVTKRLAEFNDHRRSGVGRYITAEDIARRGAQFTSDIFRNQIGVKLELFSDTSKVLVRGWADEACEASVYLNGSIMPGLNVGELDQLIRVRDIIGIEVYTTSYIPAQFQPALSGCGSIVIWTK